MKAFAIVLLSCLAVASAQVTKILLPDYNNTLNYSILWQLKESFLKIYISSHMNYHIIQIIFKPSKWKST
jgi:hypothetical protein